MEVGLVQILVASVVSDPENLVEEKVHVVQYFLFSLEVGNLELEEDLVLLKDCSDTAPPWLCQIESGFTV